MDSGPVTPGRVVSLVALLSAVVAGIVSRRLFPLLSSDNDEAIYRLQAQTIARGHLFTAAPDPHGSFTPWLAAVVEHHYVLKYTPTVSAFFALAHKLTGSFVPALALMAVATVVVTYGLAGELLHDRWAAALAASVVAASPLVVIQSGMLLAYLPTVVLVEAFAWALVAGVGAGLPAGPTGPGSAGPLVASGVALGLAAATRTYDAVLVALPLLAWAAVLIRRRRRLRLAGWWAIGALVPALGLLAFDAAATHHAFQLPFGLLEHTDSLGFGVHRLYPGDTAHHFGIAQGLAALRAHSWLLLGWTFAGVAVLPLALLAIVRRRIGPPARALAGGAGLLVVGYVFFWGAWNAVHWWGGAYYLGPFYLLPALVILAVIGAGALADLLRRRRVVASGLLAAGGVVSLVALVGSINANLTFTHQDQALRRTVRGTAPALIFVDVNPAFLMHPSAVIANSPALQNEPLFALSRGADDFTVLDRYGGQTPYLLQLYFSTHRTPHAPWGARLQPIVRHTGAPLMLRLHIDPAAGTAPLQLVLTWGGAASSFVVDPTGPDPVVEVSATGVAVEGRQPASVEQVAADPGHLGVELKAPGPGGPSLGYLRLSAAPTGAAGSAAPTEVQAILPSGNVTVLGSAPAPAFGLTAD